MNLIGICGAAGAGKDTVADILVYKHGFVKIGLADPLKRICKEVFNFTDQQLWGPSEERNKHDERYLREHTYGRGFMPTQCLCCGLPDYKIGPCYLTPRYALQQLGTQWGRDCYGDVWIDKAIDTARDAINGAEYRTETGINWRFSPNQSSRQGVVISDCRFENELTRIRAEGGRLWIRPGAGSLTGAAATHASEAGFGDLKFDAEIPWEESLKNLEAVVGILMEESPP